MTDNKPIPVITNHIANKAEEAVKKDHFAQTFSRLGTELLRESERINVITFEQFEPFIPLFNMDKEEYKRNMDYRLEMDRMYQRYTRELSINWYQPTIVILSVDNPVELYFLDRRFTRINSDNVVGQSHRDAVPGAIPRNAHITRDDLILNASSRDIVAANSTPEQIEYFKRVRAVSSLINKRFVERNLNPELKETFTESSKTDTNQTPSITSEGSFELFDDE